MRALSIRQPYAELILRGVKTVEYRSRPTRVIGERFYIYASKGGGAWGGGAAESARRIWSDDLAVPGAGRAAEPPQWMLELAELLVTGKLPTGVIVGSAVIERVTEVRSQRSEVRDQRSGGADLTSDLRPLTSGHDLRPLTSVFAWHLTGVQRAAKLRKPEGHPQPVWFRAF